MSILEQAATVMQQILGREPQLGDFGFGVFISQIKTLRCADEKQIRNTRLLQSCCQNER